MQRHRYAVVALGAAAQRVGVERDERGGRDAEPDRAIDARVGGEMGGGLTAGTERRGSRVRGAGRRVLYGICAH